MRREQNWLRSQNNFVESPAAGKTIATLSILTSHSRNVGLEKWVQTGYSFVLEKLSKFYLKAYCLPSEEVDEENLVEIYIDSKLKKCSSKFKQIK